MSEDAQPDMQRRDIASCGDAAIQAAAEAAEALDVFDRVGMQIDEKAGPKDLVTAADRALEVVIVGYLRRSRPDDTLIGEEGAAHRGTSEVTWHIDPIDGTMNFAHNDPNHAICVGAVDVQPRAGCIYVPATGEAFMAARGLGGAVMLADRSAGSFGVSNATALGQSLVATSTASMRYSGLTADERDMLFGLMEQCAAVRVIGSSAIALARVAAGQHDGYIQNGIASWDVVAGACIVREAGGRVTLYRHAHWRGGGRTLGIVASAPGIHDALVERIPSDAVIVTDWSTL